jgi:flagellar M-ring protein FliF
MLQRPEVVAMAKEGGKAVLFLLLTAIVVFGVLRPALKSIGTAPPAAEATPDTAPAALAAPVISSAQLSMDSMRQIAKSDPAAVANVVKSWVGDAKGS